MKKVIGLGNALTDILMQVEDEDIKALGISKGSMNHISQEEAVHIQHVFSSTRTIQAFTDADRAEKFRLSETTPSECRSIHLASGGGFLLKVIADRN